MDESPGIPDEHQNPDRNSGEGTDASHSPPKKIQSVLQELEIMALQKGMNQGLDISRFDKDQIDKLLQTISENEKNAFAFHTQRIEAIKDIEIKKNRCLSNQSKNFKISSYRRINCCPRSNSADSLF